MKQKNSKPSSVQNNNNKKSNQETARPFSETIKSILINKYFHLFLLSIIAVTFYINYDAIFDKKLDMNGDNIHYYSLAQSLHNGTGYSDIIGFEVKPHTHFPPGYSVFISVLLNFTDGNNFLPIKKANGVLLLASIVLLFYLMKKVTRNNVIIAFAAAMLFCVQKDLLRWSTIMMSEMLFLLLTTLVITFAIRLYKKNSFRETEADLHRAECPRGSSPKK